MLLLQSTLLESEWKKNRSSMGSNYLLKFNQYKILLILYCRSFLRNERFSLKFLSQQSPSKFATVFEYENLCSFLCFSFRANSFCP